MDFFSTFKERGFFHQCTHEAEVSHLSREAQIIAYTGFDCTAPSLHVGHLMQLMSLRLLQRAGHKPIVLLGGATSRVGDPSGRDKTRNLLSPETIKDNAASIQSIIERFLRFGSAPNDALLVNNASWLDPLGYIEFLREVGSHFSINRMLSFDSVRTRLEREQNLSFLEFNYMILQAYDFVTLHRRYACRLQVGGSDQWGNIVNGIELNRRLVQGSEVFGLTTPLITTANGSKMGKTASGAVWLAPELYSSFDYYQFWRNVDDQDVIKFLKLFTDLSLAEIETFASLQGQALNQAKKRLAFEATCLAHGQDAALTAQEAASAAFEGGGDAAALPQIDYALVASQGKAFYELFYAMGLCTTKSEARRLLRAQAVRIEDAIIDESTVFTHERPVQLKCQLSKKKLYLLNFT